MVRRVKQRFPELRVECITPGMIDKRLRILDMRWDCEYYKDGVERLKGSGGLDVVGEIGSEMSEAEIGRVLSVRDMTPVPKANIKKVTIGSPMRKKGVMDDRHNRRVSTGGMSAKLVINRTGSGRSTVDSTPLRGMSPKTIEEQDAEVKEMAPKEMDFAQEQDLAPKRKQSRGGLFGKGKKKEEVKSKEKDDVKGKEKVEDVKGKARAKDDDEPFGVPSVMRTSSGRPVLR